MAVKDKTEAAAQTAVGAARETLSMLRLPSGVTGLRVEAGEDAGGDPAIFVWFYVRDADRVSDAVVQALNELVTVARGKINETETPIWPYFGFLDSTSTQ